MKTFIALIVITCAVSVCALGQSNTNAAAVKADLERMKAELQKQVEAAQQRAREREASAATSGVVQASNRVEPFIQLGGKPYYNTNATPSSTFGVHLLSLEEHYPGISTNFTAEQRAFNTNRPIIKATRDANGKIVYLSTNYVDPVTGKLSTNKPAEK